MNLHIFYLKIFELFLWYVRFRKMRNPWPVQLSTCNLLFLFLSCLGLHKLCDGIEPTKNSVLRNIRMAIFEWHTTIVTLKRFFSHPPVTHIFALCRKFHSQMDWWNFSSNKRSPAVTFTNLIMRRFSLIRITSFNVYQRFISPIIEFISTKALQVLTSTFHHWNILPHWSTKHRNETRKEFRFFFNFDNCANCGVVSWRRFPSND